MSRFSQAEHVEAKLRLHGYDVPFLGVTVGFGVNQPATATVQLIPSSFAKAIRSGTTVHVFYKDHYSSLLFGREIYRQLFEGEVVGKSYQRAEGGKAINLHCVDLANYWIHAKQYYLNFETGQFLSAADSALFAGVNRIQGELLGTKGRISSFFSKNTSGETFDKTVIRIINDLKGVNRYFSYNLARYGIDRRIFSASTEDMAKAVFTHDLFQDFIRQQLNKQGGVSSLWKIITMLLNIVYHEIVSMPTPSFLPTIAGDAQELGDVYWTNKEIRSITLDWRNIEKKKYKDRLLYPASFVVKPNAWSLEPPACNMIFPNEVQSMNFAWNDQQKITRLQLIPTSPIFKKADLTKLTAVYQPYDLQQFIRNNYGKLTSGTSLADKVKNRNRLREFDFLTNEELERGIIPGYSTILPGAASLLMSRASGLKRNSKTKGSGKVIYSDGVFEFIHRLAEFEYHRKRAASNQFGLNLAFKPHAAAGFPAVFVDDSSTEMDVMAYVMGGSHTIYASGSATTSLQFTLARELSEEGPDLDLGTPLSAGQKFFSQLPNEPPIPDWFDDSYTHGQVGMQVYSKVLGCAGLLNAGFKSRKNIDFTNKRQETQNRGQGNIVLSNESLRNHLVEVRTKLKEAVSNLRSEYRSSLVNGSHGLYVWKKTFRPIITEEQLYSRYDGTLKGSRSYFHDQAYVGDIRFTRVEAYVFGTKSANKDQVTNEDQLNLDTTSTAKNKQTNTTTTSSTTTSDASTSSKQKAVRNKQDDVKKTTIATVKKVEPKPEKPTQPSTSVKTGRNFLHYAKQISRKKDGTPATYNFGKSGPASVGFDCSGIVFATAKLFGVTLQRHSVDMYKFNVIPITVEEALKTPGAILFWFVQQRVGQKEPRDRKHVGISVGNNRDTFEAYGNGKPVTTYKRGRANYWTHGGLIPGFTYGDKMVDAKLIYNKTPFDEYFKDIERRLGVIQQNRVRILRSYQFQLANFSAFEG